MNNSKPRIFYGHWVLVAASLCVFISVGGGLYSFSLFNKPIQSDLGWSRGMIMPAFTIWNLLVGLASPPVGRLVDRHGARKVIAAGAIMTGLGFIWLSFTSYLWHFYVAYAIIGIGMAAMGQVPASAVVSNWYQRNRGLTIGLMPTGVGMGGWCWRRWWEALSHSRLWLACRLSGPGFDYPGVDYPSNFICDKDKTGGHRP